MISNKMRKKENYNNNALNWLYEPQSKIYTTDTDDRDKPIMATLSYV